MQFAVFIFEDGPKIREIRENCFPRKKRTYTVDMLHRRTCTVVTTKVITRLTHCIQHTHCMYVHVHVHVT